MTAEHVAHGRDLDAGSELVAIDTVTLLDAYRSMLTIRRFDEIALELTGAGEIYGPVHAYIGQEAIAVGVCSHLTSSDRITSTHRGHGHCLAKGADPARMYAELLGRRDGYCGAKGGSMHIAAFDVGMLGANGIVGSGMGIAAGAALAAQLDGGDGVAAAFFGDGAVSTGIFHETLNISALWNLPIVWVCENNGWAVLTPTSQITKQGAAAFGDGHDIPSERVDGNDFLSVYGAARRAVERARRGDGPSVIEAVTYRMAGHASSRPEIRDHTLLDPWRERDPIGALRRYLVAQDVLDDERDQSVRADVDHVLNDALAFARNSDWPLAADAWTEVFASDGGEQR